MALQDSIANVQPAWDAFVQAVQAANNPPTSAQALHIKTAYHDAERAMLAVGTAINYHHPLT